MPSATPDYSLSNEQKQHFLEHGWIKLENCFSLDDPLCVQIMRDMWERLDMDPNDKSSWFTDRVHLPRRIPESIPISAFSPKAWAAICELCGGEARIRTEPQLMPPPMDEEPVPMAVINDSFIIALGSEEHKRQWDEAGRGQGSDADGLTKAQRDLLDPHKRNNYHVDGDFFHHFLDSPEQGLLPVVLFSDVNVGGGPTIICPDAIPVMAKHLAAHPEGVMPDMSVAAEGSTYMDKGFDHSFYDNIVNNVPKERFVTATGKAGDVYLLHPLMVHSGSPNYLREPRVITNPPVSLRSPMRFDRSNTDSPEEAKYSLVEQKTLLCLEKPSGVPGWAPTTERTLIVPRRYRVKVPEGGEAEGEFKGAKREGKAKKHWAPHVV